MTFYVVCDDGCEVAIVSCDTAEEAARKAVDDIWQMEADLGVRILVFRPEDATTFEIAQTIRPVASEVAA